MPSNDEQPAARLGSKDLGSKDLGSKDLGSKYVAARCWQHGFGSEAWLGLGAKWCTARLDGSECCADAVLLMFTVLVSNVWQQLGVRQSTTAALYIYGTGYHGVQQLCVRSFCVGF